MAIYYVDPNGSDLYNGLAQVGNGAGPWKTIAQVNSVSFTAGDQILFKRGGTWREQLNVPSSGANGNQITFGAYGNGDLPIINGSDDIKGTVGVTWTNAGANVWTRALTTEPKIVFFNNTIGTLDLTPDAASEWGWAANVLSIYSTSDPATAFTTLEAGQRDYAVLCKKGYITVQDIHTTKCNDEGIRFSNVWTDATVIASPQAIRVQSDYNYGIGISLLALGTDVTNGLISDGTYTNNGDSGIFLGNWDATVTGCTIQDNTVTSNVWRATSPFSITHAGIGLAGTGEGVGQPHEYALTNTIIQRNIVTGTANTPGIWADTVGAGNVIRYNKSYANYDGIMVEDSTGVQVYYNLAYGNTRLGIQVTRLVHDNLVYNNSFYGNATGIAVGWTDPVAGGVTGNIVKNNISFGNSGTALTATNGGQNDGVNGSGNVYLNNCLGPQAVNFITWGAATPDTYAAWETLYGATTTSIQADPLFVNAAGGNFHLQANSPCVEAGVSVGLTQDYDGNTVEGLPDVGAYELITSSGSGGGFGSGGLMISHGLGGRHGVT